MSGKWEPIATAPKDGSAVLLWGVAMTPVIGRYWRDGDMGGMRACWTYAMSPLARDIGAQVMRGQSSHPLYEATAYIIVGILALLIIANGAKAPHEAVTPDFHIAEAR